jgi:hypothetical protein
MESVAQKEFTPIAFHTNYEAKKELEIAVAWFKQQVNQLLKFYPSFEQIGKLLAIKDEVRIMIFLKNEYIVSNGIDKKYADLQLDKVREMINFPAVEIAKFERICKAIQGIKSNRVPSATVFSNYELANGEIVETQKFSHYIAEYGITYTTNEAQNTKVASLKKLQAVLTELNVTVYNSLDFYQKSTNHFDCHLFKTFFENMKEKPEKWNIRKNAII